ncbi:hypothetical protein N7456_003319 [Penicillium angulare]|uniref:Protein kinase domain-containing protein n=1 Tax=Penicillium angulare TaxID=116970 RepID=A0A9W9FUI3_9EURO|nr:hypothetical protein N7456_003319 [Penicillium angulare]
MSQALSTPACELSLEFYHDWNGNCLSHTIICHKDGSSWWVKVVVEGSLPTTITTLGYLRRRATFRSFLEVIDFSQLRLLDNTLSRITLTLTEESHNSIPIQATVQDTENLFIAVCHRMRYEIEEDPKRVIYPNVEKIQGLRLFDASCLQIGEILAPTVYTAIVEQRKYAYKKIDRPLYEPEDTQGILFEIDALMHCRGQPNIAQIIGLVVSENPYKTSPYNNMPQVIRGFLLQYYPRGSLEQMINEGITTSDLSLLRCALQVGRALIQLHKSERTHLDMKPSNVVLDAQGNAFLIDIGGAGSYTWDWLSPEMGQFLEQNSDKTPANARLSARVATDSWAYGQILSVIAERSGNNTVREKLQEVGASLTKTILEASISLTAALEKLQIGCEPSLA